MIMEAKPPSGYITGEMGRFVGKKLTVFVQRLRRVLCIS